MRTASGRPNPFSVPRPKQFEKRFEIKGGGFTVAGTVRELSAAQGHLVGERANELVTTYIEEQGDFPGIEQPVLSRHLFLNAAQAEAMVYQIDGGDPYNAEEYVAMAHNIPELWGQVLLLLAEASREGNAMRQATTSSSEPA